MPRVHYVKSARQDNPVASKGESYYWWKFRYGGKRYSKTYPKRSQLTQSSFLSSLYDMEDGFEEDINKATTIEELQEAVECLQSELESLQDEVQESLDNMPEHLQDTSSSGELLQERIDNLEDWHQQLDSIDFEKDEDQKLEEFMDSLREEILSCNPGIG